MWDLKRFDNNIALQDENATTLTYNELNELGNRIADVVGKRCLVFCLCTNSVGSIAGYVSFMNHKILPVLLNVHMEARLLENLLKLYKPKYLWLPVDMEIPEFSFFENKTMFEAFGYKLVNYSDAEYEIYPDLGLLLTTSGSTGSPKLVRQSYANVRINAEQIVEYLQLTDAEKPITTLPMNYTYGLSIINSHLLMGAKILVTDKSLAQKEFWHFLKDEEATSFGGVPYTYEILDKLSFFRMELPSLRYMTQAGGKLIPELHKKFAEYAVANDKRFIVMYGQCEATARMGYLPADKALDKYGSMGIAIPGGAFHLVDGNGEKIVEPNVTGELVYEGKNVTLGYAECGEDLNKADERNGILQTGDMAQFDEDGYYYIVGRKKRFLKIYGNRVNLDEIDRLVKAEFDNIACASTGIDDHMYLFITDITVKDAVRNFVVSKTGLNSAAFNIMVIDEIPKNDAGKTLYKRLEKYYL